MLQRTPRRRGCCPAGRCHGVALGWKPPGSALGSRVLGTGAEPAWDRCSQGKGSHLPGFPEAQTQVEGGMRGSGAHKHAEGSLMGQHCQVPPALCHLGAAAGVSAGVWSQCCLSVPGVSSPWVPQHPGVLLFRAP